MLRGFFKLHGGAAEELKKKKRRQWSNDSKIVY